MLRVYSPVQHGQAVSGFTPLVRVLRTQLLPRGL